MTNETTFPNQQTDKELVMVIKASQSSSDVFSLSHEWNKENTLQIQLPETNKISVSSTAPATPPRPKTTKNLDELNVVTEATGPHGTEPRIDELAVLECNISLQSEMESQAADSTANCGKRQNYSPPFTFELIADEPKIEEQNLSSEEVNEEQNIKFQKFQQRLESLATKKQDENINYLDVARQCHSYHGFPSPMSVSVPVNPITPPLQAEYIVSPPVLVRGARLRQILEKFPIDNIETQLLAKQFYSRCDVQDKYLSVQKFAETFGVWQHETLEDGNAKCELASAEDGEAAMFCDEKKIKIALQQGQMSSIRVNLETFLATAVCLSTRTSIEQRTNLAFHVFDINEDGFVNIEEIEQVMMDSWTFFNDQINTSKSNGEKKEDKMGLVASPSTRHYQSEDNSSHTSNHKSSNRKISRNFVKMATGANKFHLSNPRDRFKDEVKRLMQELKDEYKMEKFDQNTFFKITKNREFLTAFTVNKHWLRDILSNEKSKLRHISSQDVQMHQFLEETATELSSDFVDNIQDVLRDHFVDSVEDLKTLNVVDLEGMRIKKNVATMIVNRLKNSKITNLNLVETEKSEDQTPGSESDYMSRNTVFGTLVTPRKKKKATVTTFNHVDKFVGVATTTSQCSSNSTERHKGSCSPLDAANNSACLPNDSFSGVHHGRKPPLQIHLKAFNPNPIKMSCFATHCKSIKGVAERLLSHSFHVWAQTTYIAILLLVVTIVLLTRWFVFVHVFSSDLDTSKLSVVLQLICYLSGLFTNLNLSNKCKTQMLME
ncbi:hypothetical protein RFI_06189 [Reticulomyxa filosa]|uniref:EF-hand domain-containing protein n=1 Tax=Reticulomyxa filosa TaxID=46433 RepID=X6NY90_RETFI|nr:hypothetical protein RFI_06189 [Reticulomyxa filosa]|eukprot:ETO30931.1 hypothetical protein RFI_06189 [Reticulomyxa filosa]